MKKSIALFVLLSFAMVFTAPVAAQKSIRNSKSQNPEKITVRYKNIQSYSDGNGVWLKWETTSESGNIGFNIYRMVGDEKIPVNKNIIPGNYLKTDDVQIVGGNYTFFDAGGDLDSSYYIENYSTNGDARLSGLISTRYIEDITSVAGYSSAALKKDSERGSLFALKSESDLPVDLKIEVEQNTTQADPINQRVLAGLPGVKISVRKDGFYKVSRSELQTGGFDVNSSPTTWKMFKDGVEQAITVGGSGEFIEFYGTGLDNRDTDTQIYFLTSGTENGKRITSAVRRAIGGKVLAKSYAIKTLYKERTTYASNAIFNGDDDNFFGRVVNNTPTTININLTAIDTSQPVSSFDLKLQGLTQVLHQTRVFFNDTELGIVDGEYRFSASKHFDFPTSLLREGSNSLRLVSLNGSSDISFFDAVEFGYSRQFQAQQNQLKLYIPNYKAGYLDGFSSPNIRVFDITYPDQPRVISYLSPESNGNGGYRVYIPSSRARVLYAVEDSAVLSVASIKANAASTLSATSKSADMIIISYKDWMNEAQTWANYRRNQGMSVEVVNIEDVFDEFSYGNFSTNAIKDFLRYAYTKWQKQPGYVLLIGDATYNTRNYPDGLANSGSFSFVPTKLVETQYIETGSDETMADFDDDGLAEIPIGRIPIHSGQQVTTVLNKVSIFEQNVAPLNLSKGVVFASDIPNGYDFQGVSSRLRSQLSQDVNAVMVNKIETDSRTKLIAELNNGRYLINYAGHGNTGAWSASPTFFGTNDVANMSNANNLSVFTMLTCLNGFFVQPDDTLSDALLEKQTGGAAAVWASTGLTTPDVQEIMATRFFNDINANSTIRLGDLIKNAKTAIPAGRDVRLSWALLGDPALKMK